MTTDLASVTKFSWRRLFFFGTIEASTNARSYLMFPVIMQILYFCLCTLSIIAGSSSFTEGSFLLSLSILISIISISKTFSAEQNPAKVGFSLLLPSSTLEKFIAKFLLTGPILIFVNIIPFVVISLFFRLITWAVFSTTEFPPLPAREFYSSNAFNSYASFFFFHSVFFAGAIFFRSHHIVKTALSFISFAFALMVITISVGINIISPFSLRQNQSFDININTSNLANYTGNYVLVAAIVIPLILYTLAFVKFKKLEVG